ncbi:MAG: hypothetical protein EBR60_09540 [Burkholderiaceae bacterium]|nr:hypothetical protein [Burkholderiaceae bacterium]
MKAMEENKQIFVIAKNILEVIQGETFDDLIPALTMVLADVGSGCEVEIDTYLSFLCDSVKKIIAARKIIEDAFEDNTQLH